MTLLWVRRGRAASFAGHAAWLQGLEGVHDGLLDRAVATPPIVPSRGWRDHGVVHVVVCNFPR